MSPAQVRAYETRKKGESGEMVVPRRTTLTPCLAMCVVCGQPITQANKLALGVKGYRCTTCPEPET